MEHVSSSDMGYGQSSAFEIGWNDAKAGLSRLVPFSLGCVAANEYRAGYDASRADDSDD